MDRFIYNQDQTDQRPIVRISSMMSNTFRQWKCSVLWIVFLSVT